MNLTSLPLLLGMRCAGTQASAGSCVMAQNPFLSMIFFLKLSLQHPILDPIESPDMMTLSFNPSGSMKMNSPGEQWPVRNNPMYKMKKYLMV